MKITLFGSGYVGLVSGACLAEAGHEVICVDTDPHKIGMLNRGEMPIYEPGLAELVEQNVRAGRLAFTLDVGKGVAHGLLLFIAVGTPPDENGGADLKHVLSVARSIGEHMDDYRVIVIKSTVPVGTADKARKVIAQALQRRGALLEFDTVSNPEFLKEGAAIKDFMQPDRIVIGADSARAGDLMRALYEPFNRDRDRIVAMDIHSAELTKYAANAMLATRISFMNELANIAERIGADIEQVRAGIGADPRIGTHFISPGCGYGGSCFPKDVQALERTASQAGYEAGLLRAVEAVNKRQKHLLFDKINRHFRGKLRGKTFALWGLAFKPNTDDMREAPSRVLMEALWAHGAKVRAYDPEAMEEARRIYGERPDLTLCEQRDATLAAADALVVVTEWELFRSPDFAKLKAGLIQPVIFDGRNLYDPQALMSLGFIHYAIGRDNPANADNVRYASFGVAEESAAARKRLADPGMAWAT